MWLAALGYEAPVVQLVLNRSDSNVGITHADVERLLGRRPDVFVPSDRAIPRGITDGKTIVAADPRSEAAQAFVALAGSYVNGNGHRNGTADAASSRLRSLLRKEGR